MEEFFTCINRTLHNPDITIKNLFIGKWFFYIVYPTGLSQVRKKSGKVKKIQVRKKQHWSRKIEKITKSQEKSGKTQFFPSEFKNICSFIDIYSQKFSTLAALGIKQSQMAGQS